MKPYSRFVNVLVRLVARPPTCPTCRQALRYQPVGETWAWRCPDHHQHHNEVTES